MRFVDTPEVEDIVDYIGEQTGFQTAYLLPDYVPEGGEHQLREQSIYQIEIPYLTRRLV